MVKCIQVNLNHSKVAQDLLAQTVIECKADVALICEQYKIPPNNGKWVEDKTGKAAIWTCGSLPFESSSNHQHEGFVQAKIQGIYYYSCYAPPSAQLEDFQDMMDRLISDARGKRPIIISGDFNAWAVDWGSSRTNRRGMAVLEALAVSDLVILNEGTTHTYSKDGVGSIIDLTLANSALSKVIKWKISDIYTHSDHRAIIYETLRPQPNQSGRQPNKAQQKGWKAKDLDIEILEHMLDDIDETEGTAEQLTKRMMKALNEACDASMPRNGSGAYRKNKVYWWNNKITSLRNECHKLRRRYQRARGRADFMQLQADFRGKRKELRKEIAKSKSDAFRTLLEEVQNNPWGNAYKIVLNKTKGNKANAPIGPNIMANIVAGLFPQRNQRNHNAVYVEMPPSEHTFPPVTTEELKEATKQIKLNSSPGLDGIPNQVIKAAINKRPELFTHLYNVCLQEGTFPQRWKRQRLVLIPKGDKPPEEPSSYRPLCMIDTAGKVLEKIISTRLEQHTESPSGLSDKQFGFRKKRSTIDAIASVCDIAHKAIAGKRWKGGDKKYCAVITLDVKNAFNTADWGRILTALKELQVPSYLTRIVANYFENRALIYDTETGPKQYPITCGVPQGSVLGPPLWNIMYDGILRITKPAGVDIIGYADDIAIVVVAKHLQDVARNCRSTIQKIKTWLQSAGLELASHKTEAVLISSRKKVERLEVRVDGHIITSRPHIKYLGVLLDHRLNFKDHLRYVGEKASRAAKALARIMPNIGGPRQPIRNLLASVNTSILMYAAPIWASAATHASYMRGMMSAHRVTSLRVCCAFRTVSNDAASVITGRMPVEIAAKQAAALRDASLLRYGDAQQTKVEITSHSIREWQEKWNTSTKGRWTHEMIPDIQAWISKKHGEVNYQLAQMLTGHGCFREYLYKHKHVEDPDCLSCKGKPENARHVLTECRRFIEERQSLEAIIGGPITPNGLTSAMINTKEAWDEINEIICRVMRRVRRDEENARNRVPSQE